MRRLLDSPAAPIVTALVAIGLALFSLVGCAPCPAPAEPAPTSSTSTSTTAPPSPGEGLEWCVGCVRPIPWPVAP